jgi:hypothetical protein
MVYHMKTTLVIDDGIMRRLKAEAASRRTTISHLVEGALRRLLETPASEPQLTPLPTFDGGEFLVDVADRESLYDVMEDLD